MIFFNHIFLMMNMEEKFIKTDFSQCPLHSSEQTPGSVLISKCHVVAQLMNCY